MKTKIYVSEFLLNQLVKNYERTKNISEYKDYDNYKRLSNDDMCDHYYVMQSENDDTETFCYLGELDMYDNLIVDKDLIGED